MWASLWRSETKQWKKCWGISRGIKTVKNMFGCWIMRWWESGRNSAYPAVCSTIERTQSLWRVSQMLRRQLIKCPTNLQYMSLLFQLPTDWSCDTLITFASFRQPPSNAKKWATREHKRFEQSSWNEFPQSCWHILSSLELLHFLSCSD